jgi:hypothetical protein
MERADGYWVDTSYKSRIKEFLTEKFDCLKDNKRGTMYATATVGSGIVGYALTGVPLVGVLCSSISGQMFMIRSESQILKAMEERIDKLRENGRTL